MPTSEVKAIRITDVRIATLWSDLQSSTRTVCNVTSDTSGATYGMPTGVPTGAPAR